MSKRYAWLTFEYLVKKKWHLIKNTTYWFHSAYSKSTDRGRHKLNKYYHLQKLNSKIRVIVTVEVEKCWNKITHKVTKKGTSSIRSSIFLSLDCIQLQIWVLSLQPKSPLESFSFPSSVCKLSITLLLIIYDVSYMCTALSIMFFWGTKYFVII